VLEAPASLHLEKGQTDDIRSYGMKAIFSDTHTRNPIGRSDHRRY